MIRAGSAPTSTVLDEIVGRIVARFHPRRIVLFGSRARGDARPDSDYDVFVEIDSAAQKMRDLAATARGLFEIGCGWELDLKFQTAEAFLVRRDDPGTIEWDVDRQGVTLYAAPGAPASAREVRERLRNTGSFPQLLAAAESDLTTVRVLTNAGGPWPVVCFHAQQAAEKYFKLLLIDALIRPERTHRLGVLVEAVRAAGIAMPDLDADCARLTEYAIEPRYVGDAPDEVVGRLATAAAERIVAAAKNRLMQRGRTV